MEVFPKHTQWLHVALLHPWHLSSQSQAHPLHPILVQSVHTFAEFRVLETDESSQRAEGQVQGGQISLCFHSELILNLEIVSFYPIVEQFFLSVVEFLPISVDETHELLDFDEEAAVVVNEFYLPDHPKTVEVLEDLCVRGRIGR